MSTVLTCRLAYIRECPTNPRRAIPEEQLRELADSIKAHGVLQPVLLRPLGASCGEYELVCGHRRVAAARLAGLTEIPATVRELDERQVLEIQLAENMKRTDLHPLEEADGYRRLHEEFEYSVEHLAAAVGKSKAYVYGRMKLCALPPKARELFLAGTLDLALGLLVARIPDPKLAEKAAERIATGGDGEEATDEKGHYKWVPGPMKYREAVAYVQRECMAQLSSFPFALDDAKLLPAAGACTTCAKRTGAQRELFDDVAETDDRCLDLACAEKKRTAFGRQQLAAAKKRGETILSASEAKKHFEHRWTSKYISLDDQSWDITHSNKALGKALGAHAPAAILAVDPQTQKVVRLVEKTEARKAAKKAGLGPKKPKTSPAQKQRRDASTWYAGVHTRVMQQVAERAEGGDLTHMQMRAIAGNVASLSGTEVFERRGLKRYDDKGIRKLIDGMTLAQLRGLIAEALFPDCEAYSPKKQFDDRYLAACAAFGISLNDALRAQAEAAGWDPRAPKPKPAPKKKAVAKKKATKKKAAPAKSKKPAASKAGKCRVCGCTEADCSECIEETGHPCAWADDTKTICTRCVDERDHVEITVKKKPARKKRATA